MVGPIKNLTNLTKRKCEGDAPEARPFSNGIAVSFGIRHFSLQAFGPAPQDGTAVQAAGQVPEPRLAGEISVEEAVAQRLLGRAYAEVPLTLEGAAQLP